MWASGPMYQETVQEANLNRLNKSIWNIRKAFMISNKGRLSRGVVCEVVDFTQIKLNIPKAWRRLDVGP